MQQIDLNDYYYGRLFCNLRDKYSQHARSYGGGIRGSFLKSQIAKRLIPFDMSLL